MVRILGAALVLAGLLVGVASVATADQVRVSGSLLASPTVVTGCGPVDVTAVAPGDRFDDGSGVLITAGAWRGAVHVGDVVAIPVEPVARTIEVKAAGTRHGLPAEVIDRLAVEVRCPNEYRAPGAGGSPGVG